MNKAVLAVGAALLLVVSVSTGCSPRKPGKTVTVTVTPSASAPRSGGTSTSSSTSPSASPSTSPTLRKLAGKCDDVLSDYFLSQALGNKRIRGHDHFIVGVPEKNIGRLAYLNCRYGVTGQGDKAKAKVEVGVSLYATPADAAKRVKATITAYTGHGAKAVRTPVGQSDGAWLTGGEGADYAEPLLVVGDGQRTVAVNIATSVASGATAQKYAVAIARTVLKRSA